MSPVIGPLQPPVLGDDDRAKLSKLDPWGAGVMTAPGTGPMPWSETLPTRVQGRPAGYQEPGIVGTPESMGIQTPAPGAPLAKPAPLPPGQTPPWNPGAGPSPSPDLSGGRIAGPPMAPPGAGTAVGGGGPVSGARPRPAQPAPTPGIGVPLSSGAPAQARPSMRALRGRRRAY